MKKRFVLNLTHQEKHREEIESMMDRIVPLVQDEYNVYDATITGFSYDSTFDYGKKTKILFGVQAHGFYPTFEIELSRVEYEKRTPSQLLFIGYFSVSGVGPEYIKMIKKQFGLPTTIAVNNPLSSGDWTVEEKVLGLFEKSRPTRQAWSSACTAIDLFIF